MLWFEAKLAAGFRRAARLRAPIAELRSVSVDLVREVLQKLTDEAPADSQEPIRALSEDVGDAYDRCIFAAHYLTSLAAVAPTFRRFSGAVERFTATVESIHRIASAASVAMDRGCNFQALAEFTASVRFIDDDENLRHDSQQWFRDLFSDYLKFYFYLHLDTNARALKAHLWEIGARPVDEFTMYGHLALRTRKPRKGKEPRIFVVARIFGPGTRFAAWECKNTMGERKKCFKETPPTKKCALGKSTVSLQDAFADSGWNPFREDDPRDLEHSGFTEVTIKDGDSTEVTSELADLTEIFSRPDPVTFNDFKTTEEEIREEAAKEPYSRTYDDQTDKKSRPNRREALWIGWLWEFVTYRCPRGVGSSPPPPDLWYRDAAHRPWGEEYNKHCWIDIYEYLPPHGAEVGSGRMHLKAREYQSGEDAASLVNHEELQWSDEHDEAGERRLEFFHARREEADLSDAENRAIDWQLADRELVDLAAVLDNQPGTIYGLNTRAKKKLRTADFERTWLRLGLDREHPIGGEVYERILDEWLKEWTKKDRVILAEGVTREQFIQANRANELPNERKKREREQGPPYSAEGVTLEEFLRIEVENAEP